MRAAKTTWCRACGGGGDFFDGQDTYTCGVCAGSGEHDVDHGAYGVAGDGIEASYEPPAPRPAREPSEYDFAILAGLQHKPMYAGTVPVAVVDRRRVKNRAARRARRINRGRR